MSDTDTKILIVEDDIHLNHQVASRVSSAGYTVESHYDGVSALAAASKQCHHLMILDLTLPGLDGIGLLAVLRKTSQIPVIIVSAKCAEEERILGLQQGADDYMSKPFNTTELILRVEALLRRSQQLKTRLSTSALIDNLQLNQETLEASVNGKAIELTQTQFKILWELVSSRGQVLSKAYLSHQVLNRALGIYDRGLDMHLSRVRRKLNDAGWHGNRVQTVHGKGYCLV